MKRQGKPGRSGRRGLVAMGVSLAALSASVLAGPMDTAGSFEVSPSGAATYTIPIAVPPGIGGIEPKLALTYNSQAGNGLLGVGWSLSGLSAISRCPRTMAEDGVRGSVNFDANDRFCLDGQRLMVINGGTYGAPGTEYRTERESFSKIVSYGGTTGDPAYFKVWTKAGQIVEYGNTTDSRIEAQGKTQARVWAMNKLSDTKGNYLTVTYTEDNANGDFYPNRIDYTGNANTGTTSTNSVQFVYEVRPDLRWSYSGGAIKSLVRLARIAIYSASALVAEDRIVYHLGPTTKRSRISSVTLCAADGQCFPSISLTWENAIPTTRNFGWSGGFGIADAGCQLTDLFGDGRQVYYTHGNDGTHYAMQMNADGTKQQWMWSGGFGVADLGWQLADIFGDGQQVYFTHGANGSHYAMQLSPASTKQQWMWTGGLGGGTAGWQLVDLFGDGRLLYYTHNYSGEHYAMRLNPDGTKEQWGWTGGLGVGDAGWQLADLFGDGRPVYYTHNYNGEHYAMRLNPDGTKEQWGWTGGLGVGDAGWKLADLFGDGRQIYYTHNYNGQHFAMRLNPDGTKEQWGWSGGLGVGDAGWQLVDLFGDGRQIYYTHNYNGQHFAMRLNPDGTKDQWGWTDGLGSGDAGWQLGDLFGDGRPVYYTHNKNGQHFAMQFIQNPVDQLLVIANGTGMPINIGYASLANSNVYTKGASSLGNYPSIGLKIPLYVVSTVTTPNGAGGTLTTTYKYGGLKAELGTGRGLLGFAWTEATSVETGIAVHTDYRQDWPYVGLPSQVTKTISSGGGPNHQLSLVSTTYACLNPALGTACTIAAGNRYFPYASQSVESSWDLNGAALPTVTTTNMFDSYGNATQVSVTTGDGYSKTTSNQYQNDAANWILGRLTKSTVTSTTP